MSDFDPYHKWLGIPETARPVSKYRLLGIGDFESDREVISGAAERQTIYLRTLQAGEHAVLVAELLNEVSQARVTLLNADQKAEYDEQLRKQQAPEPVPEPTPVPITVVQTPAPTPVLRSESEPTPVPIPVVQTPTPLQNVPPLSPVGEREPGAQNRPQSLAAGWSTFQTSDRPRQKVHQVVWRRPAVIGICLITILGVCVLLASLIISGDAELVENNTSDHFSADKAAVDKAAVDKAAVDKVAIDKVAIDKAEADKVAIDKAAADRAAADKAFYLLSALNKGDWKTVLVLDPNNGEGKQMQAVAFTTALTNGDWKTVLAIDPDNSRGLQMQAAAEKAAAVTAALANDDWKAVLALDPDNIKGKQMQAAADKAAALEIIARAPITNTIAMTLKLIPAGTFLMGSSESESARGNDEDQHTVTITKPFYMQTTEVTQGQWTDVMGTKPWAESGNNFLVKEGADYPASYVSWDDAVAFCKQLSEKEGKTYRLPTEAEWEYACRAGTQTAWSFGNDEKVLGDYAWYHGNAYGLGEKYPHQVGLKKPNAFGLFDMHGNVLELCNDYYGMSYYKYKQLPGEDLMGPLTGHARVVRGGAWYRGTRDSRSAWRRRDTQLRGPSVHSHVGFRVVRELDDSTQSAPPTSPVPVDPPITELPSITNTIGMSLKLIPAGTFMMGSPISETGYAKDIQHKVTISKAFYMQTTEVTQRQWIAVIDSEPWKDEDNVKEGANYPASHVSWDDVVAYCEKLSEREGKAYRLPTEAEWEYACRAGTQTAWSFGNDEKVLGDYAWYDKNVGDIGENYAHQVALKKSNAFGLYDMHGNVFEWCHDYYGEDYYQQSPKQDPQGPATGSSRILRGGMWAPPYRVTSSRYWTRSAFRFRDVADDRSYYSGGYGFRLVRELD
jgi:formylglycine-generating enzyme required for sulfatase activity